ncbi:MAG: TetR/AcrR family transcriptional regulator [Deltaproteobacteria bacterium]|nr:TetR/AcrR family transcriptional regulator [Deltaproteobacteria bacterium]MBW2136024.1 TetR/AcrR family transcriptional regulator [Deltaproteobacteria bacterium]
MKERNRQDNQNSKRLIIEAGIALFAEKGYAGTSVREIVEKAGVTKPVLYYYFKSKEGLFFAILDWAAEQLEELIQRVLERPGSFLGRLAEFYRYLYQGILDNPNLFRMIHDLAFGPPQSAPAYEFWKYQRSMAGAVRAIYLEGLEKEEVREANPDEVVMLVLALIDFCFHMAHSMPESIDAERPERLLRLAFQGIGKEGLLS